MRLDTTCFTFRCSHSNIPILGGASFKLSNENVATVEVRVRSGIEGRCGDELPRERGERGVSGRDCCLRTGVGGGTVGGATSRSVCESGSIKIHYECTQNNIIAAKINGSKINAGL